MKTMLISKHKMTPQGREIVAAIQDFKETKAKIDFYKDKEEAIKNKLKEYDFEQISILDEDGSIEMLKIKQYETHRETLDTKKLRTTLINALVQEIGLSEDEAEHIVSQCFNKNKSIKKVKNIRFTFGAENGE